MCNQAPLLGGARGGFTVPTRVNVATGACREQISAHDSLMKTVAIIGASNDRNKFGNKAVPAFLQQNHGVYPVNLTESQIEGLPAFKSILDVPVRPDMVSVYLPPERLLNILHPIGNWTTNSAPRPGSLSHQTRPFIASTICFTIDNPNPVACSPAVGFALRRANLPNSFF